MPDVILIDPAYGTKNSRPQLGTLSLSAVLIENGISVEIVDLSVSLDGEDLIMTYLESDVICVGISTIIGPMLGHALNIARLVRNKRPDIPIIWGGIHPSTEPESTLHHELVDAICIGEGERTFLEIVDSLRHKKNLRSIPGIGVKENGNVIFTSKNKKYVDLDSLPLPPYHMIDLELFKKDTSRTGFFGLKEEQTLSIETSRGCTYHCTYCANAARKEKLRLMSPSAVIRSIAHIIKQGVRSVTINDDNFFINKERATEILREIVARKWDLEIFVAVRADYLSRLNEEDFRLMKRAGISMLGIGAESGSDRMLKLMNKKATVQSTLEASRLLATHQINAWFHFLYGFPNETKEDLIKTYQVMQKIAETNPYAQVNLNLLIPNPGTPSYEACIAKGWDPPSSIEEWSELIKLHKSRRPAYVDPDLEQWWADHFKGIEFPTGSLPPLSENGES